MKSDTSDDHSRFTVRPSGLETMHLLTQAKNYELRVDMEDFEGQRVFAQYSSFSVGPEAEGYTLNLGSFVRGAAGGTFVQMVLPFSKLWPHFNMYLKSKMLNYPPFV